MVGDAHLHPHCDLRIAADLARLVRQVTAQDPRPVLVLNGDLFDLDRVHREPRAGLGHARAAARVRRSLERAPQLTEALAQHCASAGTVVMLAGNHDAELLLPEVAQAVRECLAAHAPRGCIESRLHIRETLQVGGLFVQHGHQVDPDAAFYPDTGTAVRKGRLSAMPLASLMTRLLLTPFPWFESRGDHYHRPLPVLLRILRRYHLAACAVIAAYPLVGLRIAWHSLLARLRGDAPRRAALSMSSPLAVVRRLYLDRYFGTLAGVALIAALAVGLLPVRGWWAVAGLGVLLSVPPARLKGFRHRDVERCARDAAARAARGTELVVFGHLHQAFVRRDGPAAYANHGAFDGSFAAPSHDEAPGLACVEGRPYLVVTPHPWSCSLRTLGQGSESSQGGALDGGVRMTVPLELAVRQ